MNCQKNQVWGLRLIADFWKVTKLFWTMGLFKIQDLICMNLKNGISGQKEIKFYGFVV